jgi:hypothetical protein
MPSGYISSTYPDAKAAPMISVVETTPRIVWRFCWMSERERDRASASLDKRGSRKGPDPAVTTTSPDPAHPACPGGGGGGGAIGRSSLDNKPGQASRTRYNVLNLREITDWLSTELAPVDGVSADYVAVRVRESPRSWTQRVRVQADGKDPAAVRDRVLTVLRDVVADADTENRPTVAVKLHVYRAKEETACRTFAGGEVIDPNARADGDGTREGETVAVVRELRTTIGALASSVERMGSGGIRMALEVMQDNRRLQEEVAQLRAANVLAEQGQEDPTSKMIADLLPVVAPAVIQGIMEATAKRAAAAPVTG